MTVEREVCQRYARIQNPERAADMLIHGWGKPIEAGQIGAAIRQLEPGVWEQAVQAACDATLSARARSGV